MKKLALIITCLTLFLLLVFSVSAAGDSIGSATPVTFGPTYTGNISETNQKDFYSFTISTSGRITVSTKAFMKWIYCYLYDADGKTLRDSNPQWNSNTEIITEEWSIDLTSGTYYLAYVKDGDRVGSYNFRMSFASANETYKEYGQGTDNSLAASHSISLGSTYKGQIANNDEKDFYMFSLPTSGSVKLSSTAYMQWLYYKLFNEDGEEIRSLNPQWNGNTQLITLTDTVYLTSGTYYIGIVRDGSRTGNYNFSLSFSSANETFKETGKGTNNQLATANGISLGKIYKGQIALNDQKDYYKFSQPSNASITLKVSAIAMKYVYIKFYDVSGNELKSFNPVWNENTQKITFETKVELSRGTYYIGFIKDGSNCGNYSFALYDSNALKVAVPSNLRVSARSTSSLTISWNAVSGARGYIVYSYNINTGKYKKLGITSSTSYTVNDLKSGAVYRFAVKAYKTVGKANYFSDCSAVLTAATKPATPKVSIKVGTKSVKLAWTKVDGAKGYVVYWSTKKNSGYKKLGTTAKTSTSVTNLTSGKTYYFRVRAYRKAGGETVFSDYSAVKGAIIK